ncbi:DUF1642 domain-containing protein [Enterococcus dongliensis]|uniref:DUF1642 domain-containing protein n=1 Tax=Enterococcus dongliensis TaxID=2559925 RepID=UPI00288DC93E|nr:DUF1642 domain-containing protein [Enterococcus dongliensis]MDT2635563.1 DUF1642 domain-containing protein [Enterococcus dongliensis]
MNKQDILNQIEWHLDETEGENASGTFDQGYKEGCYHCEALIEQLDEPRKVKVPAFVAELLDYYRNSTDVDLLALLICFKNWYFRKDKTSEYEEAINWLVTHPEQFMKAWLDGYEVEKEQKQWVVNEGDLVIHKGEHEAKVYFVESVDDDGILLVNGIKDEFFTDLDDRSVGDESVSYFYKNFRLLAKKENLEAEKV